MGSLQGTGRSSGGGFVEAAPAATDAADPGGVLGQALVQRALGAGAPVLAAASGAVSNRGLVGQAMGRFVYQYWIHGMSHSCYHDCYIYCCYYLYSYCNRYCYRTHYCYD
jgi:hypothetical protein